MLTHQRLGFWWVKARLWWVGACGLSVILCAATSKTELDCAETLGAKEPTPTCLANRLRNCARNDSAQLPKRMTGIAVFALKWRHRLSAVRSPRQRIPTPGRVLFLRADAASCDSGVVLPATTLQGLFQRRAGPWSGQRVLSPITAHQCVRRASTGADALSARWRIKWCRAG